MSIIRNAAHVKPGHEVIFRNWEGVERTRDKVSKKDVDEYTGDIFLMFPPEYRALNDGSTLKVSPEVVVVFRANDQVECVK